KGEERRMNGQGNNPARRTALMFVVHAILCVPLIGAGVAAVWCRHLYRDYAMTLPWMTEWALSGGLLILLWIAGFLLIADVPALLFLDGRLRFAWSAFMIVLLLVLALFAALALGLPMLALLEGLSK